LPSSSVAQELEPGFAYVQERPHAWQMIFRDTTGGAEIQAARRQVQERARTVLADLLRAQPELTIPEQELEPTAELLRTAMAGLALWWQDHPEIPRAVLVELVTRMIRGVVQPVRDGGSHVSGNSLGGGSPPRTDRVAAEPALEERERVLALGSELAGEPGAAATVQHLLPRGVE
jgi:Tetracyclin repressor-like, C-terminal domain